MNQIQIMKKIAVYASVQFSNFILLRDHLNPLITSENDILLCSETISVFQLVQMYAKEKNISVKSFQANWKLYGNNADKMRDKEMIDFADELVVFEDDENERIDFLKSLAVEKGIEFHILKSRWNETDFSEKFTKSLSSKTLEELHIELEKLNEKKKLAIQKMMYKEALELHQMICEVEKKLIQ